MKGRAAARVQDTLEPSMVARASVPDGCRVPHTANRHPSHPAYEFHCSGRWKHAPVVHSGWSGSAAQVGPFLRRTLCEAGPEGMGRLCGQPAGPLDREHERNRRRV